MKKQNTFLVSALVVSMVFSGFTGVLQANGQVKPPLVEGELPPSGSMEVNKQVTTPEIPPIVDICLLEDETGSFADDIENLQGGTTASDIYDTIVAASPDAQFAVAGFRDYPDGIHGSPGDWVYRLLSGMSPLKANWLNGIALLTAGGGADPPEAQYDAIVAAAQGDDNCGWRAGVQRVLVVATDAPFHLPGINKPHVNDATTTITALQAQNIIVVGLKAPGAGAELDNLAAATGGSVQTLSPSGADIAQAILDGLKELTTDIWWEVEGADAGLTITLTPAVHEDVPGATTVNFTETITVADDPDLQGQTLEAVVVFIANEYPEEGKEIGREKIKIYVPDVTPPEVECTETVNPHGKNVPPAGKTTLPGPKGGQNEDGFYELSGEDNLDETIKIWVTDENGAGPFGPFAPGDKVKITESPDSTPESKKMGSAKGQAGAIAAHIILSSDAVIYAIDASGNEGETSCYVPPLPK